MGGRGSLGSALRPSARHADVRLQALLHPVELFNFAVNALFEFLLTRQLSLLDRGLVVAAGSDSSRLLLCLLVALLLNHLQKSKHSAVAFNRQHFEVFEGLVDFRQCCIVCFLVSFRGLLEEHVGNGADPTSTLLIRFGLGFFSFCTLATEVVTTESINIDGLRIYQRRGVGRQEDSPRHLHGQLSLNSYCLIETAVQTICGDMELRSCE